VEEFVNQPLLDVRAVIDASPMSRLQCIVVSIAGLIIVLDGYDMLAIAFTGPALARDLGLAVESLTAVFAAGTIGIVIGSIAVGPLADRFGRRWFLLGATLLFALATLGPTLDLSFSHLVAYRLVTGLGLGAATPCAIALTAEYAPERHRSLLNNLMFAGFPVGGLLAGFITTELLPQWGWRWVFYIGGGVPLLLLLPIALLLPESVIFLARNSLRPQHVRELVRRIDPRLPSDSRARYVVLEPSGTERGINALFTDGRAAGTVLLWIVFFSNLVVLLFLNSWLPALMIRIGLSLSGASAAATLMMAGGIGGGLSFGALIDRFGATRVLVASFTLTALLVALIGRLPVVAISFLMFAVGFGLVGCQLSINTLPAIFYPTEIRSTGIGWALGIGNLGAVAGPMLGGAMMFYHFRIADMYTAAALPLLIAAGAVYLLGKAPSALPPLEFLPAKLQKDPP
jgi:AAHS family 4-hydroxybenzoate transporter-like MFS transporter